MLKQHYSKRMEGCVRTREHFDLLAELIDCPMIGDTVEIGVVKRFHNNSVSVVKPHIDSSVKILIQRLFDQPPTLVFFPSVYFPVMIPV